MSTARPVNDTVRAELQSIVAKLSTGDKCEKQIDDIYARLDPHELEYFEQLCKELGVEIPNVD